LVFYPNRKREVGSQKQDAIIDTSTPTSRISLPTSQTDCILSMEETYHLNLSKTDLVVLSSCESGIGELAKGEGMMAVNRGFLYAGAKNVVSTLFKVYDKPSSLLTQYLFEGILEGKGYSESLRLAKLRLLKVEEVDVKSWCGFVLIGGN
ncbi:MAG: CHAT domain-containing protein, partial [Chitinophagales bacterium]